MTVCDWVNETCSRELWVLSWHSKVGCKCQSICQLHNWIICSKQAPSVCHIQQRSIKETSSLCSCFPGTNYLKQWMHNSPHNSTNSWQLFWTSAYCVSIKCSCVCLTERLEGGGELCRRRRKAFHWIYFASNGATSCPWAVADIWQQCPNTDSVAAASAHMHAFSNY